MKDQALRTSSSWLHGSLRKNLIDFILRLDTLYDSFQTDPLKKLDEWEADISGRLDALEKVFGVESKAPAQDEEPDSAPFQAEELDAIAGMCREELRYSRPSKDGSLEEIVEAAREAREKRRPRSGADGILCECGCGRRLTVWWNDDCRKPPCSCGACAECKRNGPRGAQANQVETLDEVVAAAREELGSDFEPVRLGSDSAQLERAQIVADVRAQCDAMTAKAKKSLTEATRFAAESSAWNRVAEFIELGPKAQPFDPEDIDEEPETDEERDLRKKRELL